MSAQNREMLDIARRIAEEVENRKWEDLFVALARLSPRVSEEVRQLFRTDADAAALVASCRSLDVDTQDEIGKACLLFSLRQLGPDQFWVMVQEARKRVPGFC